MSLFLSDFQKVRPSNEYAQDAIFEKITAPSIAKQARKYSCSSDHIGFRSMFAPLQAELLGELKMEERTSIFQNEANSIFEHFYANAKLPDELIHVTCTGYHSPSAAQLAMAKRGGNTAVTHVYHMGCLAAIPAIKIGMGFLASGKKQVDVIHTELCSLHYNPKIQTPEQFVAHSLFADGAIKYTLSLSGSGFRVLAIHEQIIPSTGDQMSWTPESWGLKMTLSKKIPFSIASTIGSFVERLTKDHKLENPLFAIHPGGPKIIEAVVNKLSLSEKQVESTRKILYNYGNMSSATLPHIWEEILESYPVGTDVVSLAFGPGLTLCGILLRKE